MEQVGIKLVGTTALKGLLSSTGEVAFKSCTIVGNAAATYPMGAAMVNSTAGLKKRYTNAVSVFATPEAVGTGNGSTKTFDLAHANVVASSLKGFVADAGWGCKISVGTGTAGVDQIVFAVAPTNLAAITATYDYHADPIVDPCILAEDVTTTVGGGNVTTNGVYQGHVVSDLVVDSAGAAVDSYFKAALPLVAFE